MPVTLTHDSEYPNLYLFNLQKLWQWSELIAQVECAIARANHATRKDVIVNISALSYAPLGTFERLTQVLLMTPPLNGGLIVIATSNILIKSYVRLFQRITPRAQCWILAHDLAEARALIMASRQEQALTPHKPVS